MGANKKDVSGDKNPKYRHGFCVGGADKKMYNSWTNMKSRCVCPSHPKYHRYGGRGISICNDWLSFSGFKEWAENNGWFVGATLDRIDNNGNYEPSNCQWVSAAQNSRKKSTTKLSRSDANDIRSKFLNGKSMGKLAMEYGVVDGTIWFIVNNITHVDDGKCSKKKKKTKVDGMQAN